MLLELARTPGLKLGPVTVIGHSAGAQALQLFASDPSAPIDAVVSLDATEDYAMISDPTWAYYTDPLMRHRENVRVPLLFVAGPEALFELADSLIGSNRWLLTVPDVTHNEFISQGIIRLQLEGGLEGDDPDRDGAAARRYEALVEYLGAWLSDHGDADAGVEPPATPLDVIVVRRGENAPVVGGRDPRTARETRALFGQRSPAAFAGMLARVRAAEFPSGGDGALMMVLVDAIRKGRAEYVRATYAELLERDSTAARVLQLIERRALLFERIEDVPLAREWRGFVEALRHDGLPTEKPD